MPDKPAAEVVIDVPLIRLLLASQAAEAIDGAVSGPLVKVAEGWDSEVWRLGDDLAVRLPRRAVAAPLVLNEQRVLPHIARRLAPLGIRVPAPLVHGIPEDRFPWAWSVVPWIDGASALELSRAERDPWAAALGGALRALHTEAPADHPQNPFRGHPLATRSDTVEQRLRVLRDTEVLDSPSAAALRSVWETGLAASQWAEAPVWIHGDLHPGNLVSDDGSLTGIIDFGDVTAGDPAYDLAVAWLAFDSAGRRRFRGATEDRYDDDTWTRARSWAAAVALMMLTHSDDNPDYFALGQDAAAEVISDSP